MATELWLVRHGQAAFASDDYDRLTDLGWQQARWLGGHLGSLGLDFARIASGTLRRQKETAQTISESLDASPEIIPGFEEYNADALLTNAGFQDRDPSLSRRDQFRRLRGVLLDWSEGKVEGAETWQAFNVRVKNAVDEAVSDGAGRVLVVSSGGAIALALAQVMGLTPAQMIDFNLQARNTGITRLVFARDRVYVNMINAVPHLERPDRMHAETYS
ncbi:MAG: histidine phosphatase family protein [Pseudomonadota bacterium]